MSQLRRIHDGQDGGWFRHTKAKGLYSAGFDWVAERVSDRLIALHQNLQAPYSSKRMTSIDGLSDGSTQQVITEDEAIGLIMAHLLMDGKERA